MASTNNREPLLCCFKFGASFQSHGWIQTGVTIGTQPIWVKINEFCPVWPWNLIILKNANLRDLIAAMGLVILVKLDSNRQFFSQCDLEIWWMTFQNRRALLLYCQAFASFQSDRWIQTGVHPETLHSGLNWWYFVPCTSFQSHGWI